MGPKFDDVRIYNRALSATEIKQTLQCGKVERAIAGAKRVIGASTAVALGRNVRPQNHDQEDQDRIQHDPRDVGSPTPFLLYGLPAHGGLSPFNGLRNQIELFAKFRAVSRYGHDFRHAISETHSHESHAPDVKSEKPRKSRERKRSKRVKRQQPECKEKYRECQCRANRKQDHKLSKPSARH